MEKQYTTLGQEPKLIVGKDPVIGVWPTQPFGPRPPLGEKKIFQKEQPVIVKKPSLSIHIELYI